MPTDVPENCAIMPLPDQENFGCAGSLLSKRPTKRTAAALTAASLGAMPASRPPASLAGRPPAADPPPPLLPLPPEPPAPPLAPVVAEAAPVVVEVVAAGIESDFEQLATMPVITASTVSSTWCHAAFEALN